MSVRYRLNLYYPIDLLENLITLLQKKTIKIKYSRLNFNGLHFFIQLFSSTKPEILLG